jgi:hypothetical protein
MKCSGLWLVVHLQFEFTILSRSAVPIAPGFSPGINASEKKSGLQPNLFTGPLPGFNPAFLPNPLSLNPDKHLPKLSYT